MSEGIFREAGREEDASIRAVLAEAFPDNPKARPEMTAWQYWDNPFGQSRTWVYEDDGAIVAVYTGIPVPVLLGGRPEMAALGIDAAVAPSHQGRRLFTPLSRALYDDLGRHGMTYTLAYPSTASYKGITRAGWRELAQLRVNVLPLSDQWVARRFHVPALTARAVRAVAFRTSLRSSGERCEKVPSGIDELWERCASRNAESGIIRDAAWWGWRYGANPDSPYRYYETRVGGELRGAAVTRTVDAFGGRFAYVLEMLAADAAAAQALVGAVVAGEAGSPGGAGLDGAGLDGAGLDGAGLDGAGVDGAALVTLAGSAMDQLSRAAGFRRLPRKLEPHPQYFGAVPNAPSAPDPTTLTWSVAWGDLDHL